MNGITINNVKSGFFGELYGIKLPASNIAVIIPVKASCLNGMVTAYCNRTRPKTDFTLWLTPCTDMFYTGKR